MSMMAGGNKGKKYSLFPGNLGCGTDEIWLFGCGGAAVVQGGSPHLGNK